MYICMKTITISDDVYEKLKRMKRPGESFSDLLRRLLNGEKVPLTEFYGKLRDSKSLEELFKSHLESRKKAEMRF